MSTTFVYKARNAQGQLVSGEVDGQDIHMAKSILVEQGLFPLTVQPSSFEVTWSSLFTRRARQKELLSLTRQFAVMFRAGTPMGRILGVLAQQARHPGLKKAFTKIQKDVFAGVKLSRAFGKFPQYFNRLYVSLLAAGEEGGILEETLDQLAQILRNEHSIRAKVKSATLYPKIVVGSIFLVATLMLVYVIPVFENFYASFEAELPAVTIALMQVSHFLTTYWFLALALMASLVAGWKMILKTKEGKRFFTKLGFKVPVFGNLHTMILNARFGHLVSSLYRAGLPLSGNLEIVAQTMDGSIYSDEVLRVKASIDKGDSLSQAMRQQKYFSPLILEAVDTGEETGEMDTLLESTATFFDEEIEATLKNLTTLLEPMLLFFVFLMIGFLAFAVFSPIWNLSNVVLG